MKLSPVVTMTEPQFVSRLKQMANTARTTLCGFTTDGSPLGDAVGKYLEDMAADSTDPVKRKERREFLARCENDPKLKQQLCGVRIEQFDNYILANQQLINMFFEVVNLANDDRPA